MDKLDFRPSLTKVSESQFEETPRTNSHISHMANHKIGHRTIIEEIGLQKSSVALHKPVSRRHSETPRNGMVLQRLKDQAYFDKILKPLHLKGHVKYLKSNDVVLFICSPM